MMIMLIVNQRKSVSAILILHQCKSASAMLISQNEEYDRGWSHKSRITNFNQPKFRLRLNNMAIKISKGASINRN